MPTLTVYDFDPTGLLPANLVSGEIKSASPSTYRDYVFIVPDAAPFFKEGLEIRRYPSNTLLVEGVDYFLTHKFYDASISTAKSIYGSISFFNSNLVGSVTMKYQTVGGPWVLTVQQQIEALYNEILNPRVAYWEDVIQLPFQFPVINHGVDLNDLYSSEDVNTALQAIAAAIIEHNNASDSFATLNEALAGIVSNRQMSPSTTKAVVQNAISTGVLSNLESTFLYNTNLSADISWDLLGDYVFVDSPTQSSFKLSYTSNSFRVESGTAYFKGVRAVKSNPTLLANPGVASDLHMIVLLADGLSHMTPTVDFTWMAKDAVLAYNSGGRVYYSYKIATMATTSQYVDLRPTQRRGNGLAFDARLPLDRVIDQNAPLKINTPQLIDGANTGGQILYVTLPPTTGLAIGDRVPLYRTHGTIAQVTVYNLTTDTVRLEKRDKTVLIDTSFLFNINSPVHVVWMGTYWGI